MNQTADLFALGTAGPPAAPGQKASRIRIWRGDSPEPVREIPTSFSNGVYSLRVSPDGRWVVTTNDAGIDPIHVWRVEDGKLMGMLNTGFAYLMPVRFEFSPSGRYLLVTRQVWDLEAGVKPEKVWDCDDFEPDHAAWNIHGPFRSGAFLDERHVLIAQDAQLQVWDWRERDAKRAKKLSLFWLPGIDWLLLNHATGHWRSSPLGATYLRCLYRDPTNGKIEWISPTTFQDRTGFKPDPKKLGIELGDRS
jgi:WD40 repeat protein